MRYELHTSICFFRAWQLRVEIILQIVTFKQVLWKIFEIFIFKYIRIFDR